MPHEVDRNVGFLATWKMVLFSTAPDAPVKQPASQEEKARQHCLTPLGSWPGPATTAGLSESSTGTELSRRTTRPLLFAGLSLGLGEKSVQVKRHLLS